MQDKTARLNIRPTPAELRELRENARLSGMTLSAYGRRRLLGHAVATRADAEMIRELRRIGGLLKQIHGESKGPYSETTGEALRHIAEAIRKIARDP